MLRVVRASGRRQAGVCMGTRAGIYLLVELRQVCLGAFLDRHDWYVAGGDEGCRWVVWEQMRRRDGCGGEVSVRWPFRVRKSDYCGIGMGSGVIAHQLTRYVSAWHMQTWVCVQELHAGGDCAHGLSAQRAASV
jgi:hypothetical protein